MIKKLNNKGVTIVEIVVAMVLFVILSSISFTVSLSSLTNTNKANLTFSAVNKVSDVIAIYKVSNNNDNFCENLKSCFDLDEMQIVDNKTSFTINELRLDVTIIENEITVTAFQVDETNLDKSLYSNSYKRGI